MVQPASNRLLVESQRGAANGIASLDATGKLPETHIPTRLGDTALNATYAPASIAATVAAKANTADVVPVNLTGTEQGGALAALRAALDYGVDTGLLVVGDSTGNEPTEWVYLFAQYVASQYPGTTVSYRDAMGNPPYIKGEILLQTGASGERGLDFNGTTGYATIADSADHVISGDFFMRLRARFDVAKPATEQVIVSKWGAAGNRSYRLYLKNNLLNFDWSPDGTTINTCSTSVWNEPNGGTMEFVVQLDVDNGAGGHTATIGFVNNRSSGAYTNFGTFTGTGVTSIFTSTAPVQLGAQGGTSAPTSFFDGAVLSGVMIRSGGINGASKVPALPTRWTRSATGATPIGSPLFTIVNASRDGADITYHNTYRDMVLTDFAHSAVLLSLSYNDGTRTGTTLLADYTTWLNAAKTSLPLATFGMVIQGATVAPAVNIEQHTIRAAQLTGWAIRNGLSVIDVRNAFLKDPRGVAALVTASDGLHPNADGSIVWSETVKNAFKRRS